MKTIIYNGRLICGNEIIPGGYVVIEDGIISEIGSGPKYKKDQSQIVSTGVHWIDAEENYVSPGFIDLHVHGVGICDIYLDVDEGLRHMSKVLAMQGVTFFMPTLATAPVDAILKAVSQIRDLVERNDMPGAKIAGINIEGPFLNPKKSGAQPKEYIKDPDVKVAEKIIEHGKGMIRMMTIAPEMPGNLEIAALLKKNNIIPAIGHTLADYEQTMTAINSGMLYVSHMFNAMTPFNHREPGALGAILMSENVITEIIADGTHVHPAVIKFLCHLKDHSKIVLVTDALTGIMRHDDEAKFCGKQVKSNGICAYAEKDMLMGSVTPMNKAVQNIINYTGMDLTEAVKLATINPAAVIGVNSRKGTLEIGKDADIVIFGADFSVKTTIVKGKNIL